MAEVVRYVNTASSAGGDGTTNLEAGGTRAYASLNEWEANEQTDLVTDTDTHVVNCGVGSGSAADTTATVVTGWTTGASNYITIQANPSDTGGDQRAQMPYSTSIYRLGFTDPASNILEIDEDHTIVFGIQVGIDLTSTLGGVKRGIFIGQNADTTGGRVVQCLVRTRYNNSSNATTTGIDAFATSSTAQSDDSGYINCVATLENQSSGKISRWIGFAIFQNEVADGLFYNCTAIGDDAVSYNAGFFKDATNQAVAKNCLADVSGSATNDYGFRDDGTPNWGASSSNNASAQADAPGSDSRDSQTFTFVDAAGGDYHLASDDAGAKGYGTDLSGDATYPFSDDFDGDNRLSEVWDIGADQTPILVGGTHVVLTAPAVVEGAAGQSRTVDVASLITWSPAVTATGGGASATIDSAGLIAHAPAATVSAIISATVAAPQAIIYAPEVTRQAGAVSRAADGAPVILHAPELTAGFGQTVVIGSALWICVAPGVFQRIEAEPPLRVVADSTTTYVKVRHGGVWV